MALRKRRTTLYDRTTESENLRQSIVSLLFGAADTLRNHVKIRKPITMIPPDLIHEVERLSQITITPSVVRDLSRELGQELSDVVLQSASLQKKAQEKFGPGTWWVTERSLQQATPWQVATLKATWFSDHSVIDLCCGVGGDSMAFAKRGTVIAIDRDPLLVEMTKNNLAQVSDASTARCDDVMDVSLSQFDWLHIDPDRRTNGHRSTNADQFSANLVGVD